MLATKGAFYGIYFLKVTGYYIITNEGMIRDERDDSMKKSNFYRKFILSLLVLCVGVLISACSSDGEVGCGEGVITGGGAVSDERAEGKAIRVTQTDENREMGYCFATHDTLNHTQESG